MDAHAAGVKVFKEAKQAQIVRDISVDPVPWSGATMLKIRRNSDEKDQSTVDAHSQHNRVRLRVDDLH